MKSYKPKKTIKELNGFWWIPSDPDHQYFGNLKIDESGEIYLNIYGNSREDSEGYLDLNHKILYGICEDSTKVTLFSLHRSNGRSSDFFRSSIEYRYCLVGFHIQNFNEIKFNEIIVNISNLFGWFIDYEVQLIQKKKERFYVEDSLFEDEKKEILITAGNYESSSSVTRKIEIQRKGYLKFKYKKPEFYYDIFEELKLLSMFLSILAREAIYIQEVFVPYKDIKIPKRAKLYFNNQTYFKPITDRNIKNMHGRRIITDKFDSIMSTLFNIQESNKFIIEVLSDKYLRGPGNQRTEFFNIISAYESWHRNNITELDEGNIKTYEAILDSVEADKNLLNFIRSRSILFKGMSLPKRIDYLLKQDSWNLITDKKKFKNIITSTRNMIAHNLGKSKGSASFSEMIIIHNVLHVILEKLFLRFFPLPEEFINSHIQNHPVIERVIRQIYLNKDNIRF